MLKLTKQSYNLVYMSLTENSVDAYTNHYLLVFTNLQTRESEAKVAQKGSVNDRAVQIGFFVNYNLSFPDFTMQENSFFKYDIYEQTSSSNTDITDSSVLGLRETGKAWVNGTSEVVYVKQAEANNTNSVYLKV